MEKTSLEIHGEGDGWVIDLMRSIGASYFILFQIYNEMFETKISPFNTGETIKFLLSKICHLLQNWIAVLNSNSTERFPVKSVDDAISKYLVTNIPHDTLGILSNLQAHQKVLRRKFG